jgi:hypothetical protein
MLDTVPEQGHDYKYRDKEAFNYVSRFDQSQKGKKDKIINYFINIEDKIKIRGIKIFLMHS